MSQGNATLHRDAAPHRATKRARTELLVVIPARGGSKGLVDKNLRVVGGIPLVARAVRLAHRTLSALGSTGRVVCSTDSEAIAAVAREWGAEVPFMRPATLSRDDTPSAAVVLHALQMLGDPDGGLLLLQPTSPLTEVEDVVGTIKLFTHSGAPVISVCESEHPVAWAVWMREDGRLVPVLHAPSVHQRQQAQTSYAPNGAIYVARPDQVRQAQGFINEATRGYLMPRARSVDVDVEADLRLADAALGTRPVASVPIGPWEVGREGRCFIIAEAGVNHNGNVELARRLVDAAADAGADAVKFQTYRTESVCARQAPKAGYQARTTGAGSQFEMLKQLELPYAWHGELKRRAEQRGMVFLSTPDDIESARFLCSLDVAALKVGSAELTNLPFLRELVELGKPLILSTGMATMADVASALDAVEGRVPVVLLHCVSSYPAPEEELDLRCIGSMRASFGVPVGLSDHTTGDVAAVAGVACGMAVLEKHLTLDHSLPGPDQGMSYDQRQLAELVVLVRRTERMMGSGLKGVTPSEAPTLVVVRRTLTYAGAFDEGHVLRQDDLLALRTGGDGLAPAAAGRLVGRALRRRVPSGGLASEADLV